jgi:hypothetical protein
MRALLTDAVRRVTGLEIGPDAGFFEAGLTSALLIGVHTELLARIGRPTQVATMFKYATVRTLAAHLTRGGDDDAMTAGQQPAPRLRGAFGSRRELRAGIRARVEGRR